MAKKISEFKGFTPQTFQFFKDLEQNNYKEWFDSHKHIYENEILAPLKALVTTLSPAMHNIDPDFEFRPHKVISRIYRDIRFSKDKTPYKTGMWFTFQIPVSRELWTDYPGYFMELRKDEYTIGMGLFAPKKKIMDIYREEVAYIAEEFKQVTQETVLNRGFEIGGEEYKRLLANDLSEYFQPWIQRKGIWVYKTRPVNEDLYSDKIVNLIQDDFTALEWLYTFFKNVASGE